MIAREGWSRIAIALGIAATIHALAGLWWALPCWLVCALVIQFFRDPKRIIPIQPGIVVAPAHGRVVSIGPGEDPFSGTKAIQISIFMNIFSVHSNRIPVSGDITQRRYHPGRFFNAELDKASRENERCAISIHTDNGFDVSCVQIAGLVARRILTYVKVGDRVQHGQRFGFIRFGSRVDLYLPPQSRVVASLGKWVLSGSDIIAYLPAFDKP
jgi:phosphatidylserine decarboxylase